MADLIKVFRDPIYNLISFNKKDEEPILEIIGTPEFQRLRRIRQLGLSNLTFPTATHDRFSHSIGVAYLAGELFDCLNVDEKHELIAFDENPVQVSKAQLRLLLRLAGLLHDIGHGPFSHAFEKTTDFNHEDMSVSIINDQKGNIYQIFSRIHDDILRENALFWITEIISGTFKPIWVKEIISSQLDVDRIDYLLRDAYMCGVNYASFDIKWLFQNIEIGEIENENNRLGLLINAKKGIHAVEAFIVSRYHMYEQVYFHKTTRGFEMIIQRIFEKLKEIVDSGQNLPVSDNHLLNFFTKHDANSFLQLDDFKMINYFKELQYVKCDDSLKMLCSCLINRTPFKMIKEVENDSLFSREEYAKIEQELDLIGKDYYFEDEYLNVAYKDPYLLGKKTAELAEHIWLKKANGELIEFAQVSPIVKSMQNSEFRKKRAYVHRDFQNTEFFNKIRGKQP